MKKSSIRLGLTWVAYSCGLIGGYYHDNLWVHVPLLLLGGICIGINGSILMDS